jgi:hypothetical protein
MTTLSRFVTAAMIEGWEQRLYELQQDVRAGRSRITERSAIGNELLRIDLERVSLALDSAELSLRRAGRNSRL